MDDMAKTERFAVRLAAEQNALIRRAAEVKGTDLINFTVTATLAHARDVLADRRLFMLDAPAWSGSVSVLDRQAAYKPRLERLFAEPRSSTSERTYTAQHARSGACDPVVAVGDRPQ